MMKSKTEIFVISVTVGAWWWNARYI